MSSFARLRGGLTRLLGFVRQRAEERDLDEEMRFHIEQQTEKSIRSGMTPGEARHAALVSFGGREQWREAARDEFRSRPLEDFIQDLQYGARALGRNPEFAATAVLTLALGIAATVTVFSFVDSLFLRTLPAKDANRLVRVYVSRDHGGDGEFGYAAYRLLRERATAFDAVAAHYSTAPLYVTANGQSREEQGAVVSASYFPMLGIAPRLGRFFAPSEDSVPDRDPVAVIGSGVWESRFGSDPAIVGKPIRINGRDFQIVGVAPAGFYGIVPDAQMNDIWIPTMMFRVGYRWCDALAAQPPCAQTRVLARLAPGSTISRARVEVSALERELLARSDPDDSLRHVIVAPAVGVSPQGKADLTDLARLLSAIAAILLIVACANVSGLLLVRGVSRQREIALRTALGAGRARIVRQLLAESLVLSLLGGALGVVLSLWTSRALVGFFAIDSEGYSHFYDVSASPRVLGFATGVSLLIVLVFGALPAIHTSRGDMAERLKGGAGSGIRGARTRTVLISAQVALSLILLVGAALLTRSFDRITSSQTFDANHVALLRLRPRLVGYAPAIAQAFLRRALEKLQQLPDVESVAMGQGIGFLWLRNTTITIARPGDLSRRTKEQPEVYLHDVTPAFFATLRVPLLRGRDFSDKDLARTPRVAIVNQTLAQRLWPNAPALEQPVLLGGKEFRVVGVVEDFRPHNAGEAAQAAAFVPFWQNDFEQQVDARVAIRVKGDPALALPALRMAIATLDPAVPVTETLPMTTQVGANYTEVNLGGTVLRWAAALTLFLCGIGLYGVVAFLVARRTREIGVRLAVGARPSDVVGLFIRQGLAPMVVGSAVGLLLALAGARLLSGWLYGVSPNDAVAFIIAAGAIEAVALLASYVPARRAARVDPVTALRTE